MMGKMFEGMSDEDKRKLMASMMPGMMSSMMPEMMRGMMGGERGAGSEGATEMPRVQALENVPVPRNLRKRI